MVLSYRSLISLVLALGLIFSASTERWSLSLK